jgi:signal transduction histidine kinase
MRLAVQHLRMVFRDGGADFAEVLKEVTDTLLGQIDALSRIASEFSRFGRMPEPKRERVDVAATLREAMNLFGLEKDVAIIDRISGDVPDVIADREELRRAFINIFRNALQAMEGHGTITVSAVRRASIIDVRIGDTGPGIPAEVRAKLFTPNFSTKSDGMGLGLAIVKSTLMAIGGTIRIESERGLGSTVIMEIPLAREEH